MKTLILYATKYGATHTVAERVAQKLGGDCTLHNLMQPEIPSLSEYDRVIVGSSVYAGSIRNEAKKYLTEHADELKEKQLGLFVCGLGGNQEREKEALTSGFPLDMRKAAKAIFFLGGIFDPHKAGFAERLIIKAITKKSGYIDTVNENAITRFVKNMD